jgi:hypothetical protein
MTPGHEDDAPPGLSIKLLWLCLVLAAAGLFALLPDDDDLTAHAAAPRAAGEDAKPVLAASPTAAFPRGEIEMLRKKVRHLEAEVAALQRCRPGPVTMHAPP